MQAASPVTEGPDAPLPASLPGIKQLPTSVSLRGEEPLFFHRLFLSQGESATKEKCLKLQAATDLNSRHFGETLPLSAVSASLAEASRGPPAPLRRQTEESFLREILYFSILLPNRSPWRDQILLLPSVNPSRADNPFLFVCLISQMKQAFYLKYSFPSTSF